MCASVVRAGRVGGVVRSDCHQCANGNIEGADIELEFARNRIKVLRPIVYKGTEVSSALSEAVVKGVPDIIHVSKLGELEHLAVSPAFFVGEIHIDNYVGIGIFSEGARAAQTRLRRRPQKRGNDFVE